MGIERRRRQLLHDPTAGTPTGSQPRSSSSELIDGALIAPGKTFSFNEHDGERTAEKGFRRRR